MAVLIVGLFPDSASAIQLSGIYSSACEREIGIIMYVDDAKVQVLNLEGDIRNIRRFDIIYIAHYPMGKVIIPKISSRETLRIADIKTLYKNEPVDLVKGWLTDLADNKMSFLTTDGIETVIDTNDVWDIDFKEVGNTVQFDGNGSSGQFYFVHPYPFASCEKEEDSEGKLKIYPHHLLETPLLIKTELDRLQAGHEELGDYVREKKFYPRPQIHTNISTLAIWASANLRYGSSSTRNSNFIPVVRNESSDGLYKYQSVVITGAAPMPYSVHEEPQTQLYYSMKASYFHMSLMYDLIQEVTNKYRWQFEDLENHDDRENERLHLGGGFDYSHYALEYSLVFFNYAVRNDDLFHSRKFLLSRIGAFYSHRKIKVSLYYGFANGEDNEGEEDTLVPSDDASPEEIAYINYLNEQRDIRPDVYLRFRYYRLNLDFPSFTTLKPSYSLIYKRIKFEREPDIDGLGNFMYEGDSLTNAIYLNYEFPEEDLFLNGFVSVELTSNKRGITDLNDSSKRTYFKGGVSVGLVF